MYIDTTNAAAGRIVLNAEKADKDAYGKEIHRFYESMVPQGTVIPASVNLNTINFLQVGNYYCSKNDTVKTLTNCPTDLAFMMQVYSPLNTTVDNESTSTWVYRLRKITDHKGHEYYQAVNSNGTAANFIYGEWYEKLDSEGKLTLSGDLSGSIDLSNNMTLTADITASGVTAGKYGPTANSTPAHGASFKVPEFTVAADGRITAATTRTITLPADNNTTYGLSAESGHIIQLKDSNNGVTKVTLVQGNDMVLTTDTTNDKITIAHEAFTTTKASTNTTAKPAHGGTFDVLDSVTTDNGHVTGYTVKTVTLPADNNATYTFNNNKTNTLTLTGAGGGATTSVELKAGTQTSLTPGDKMITINHGTVFTTPNIDTASPSHGGTFKAIDAITTDNGHITGYTTKTITLPADNNTTYTISAKNNIITLDGSSGTDTNVTLAAGNDIGISTGASDNKITIKHSDFTTTPTTSSATDKSPAHGGSFSVIDGITTDNGHITSYTTKSVKLPADNNTTSSLSAEYNSTDKKHQIRLTESSGTTYNVELAPGNDITLATDTTNDKITITHEAFTTTGTTSSATDKTPAHGGSFSVIDGITTDNGHVTGYTTKSIKLPADNNTTYTLDLDSNAKVTLNASTGTDTNLTFAAGNDIVVTPDTTNKKITIKHQDFTTTKNSTNATAAPAHGGTVEVLGSITVDNGHVTGYQNKTITLPADNNTTSALSAEYNTTDKKHQIRLTESTGTTYNVELIPGNDITMTTDTANDTITITHEAFTTTPTTSSATDKNPAAGGSFSVVDGVVTDNGHITGYTTKTVTLPPDNNTTYSLSVDANKKVTLTGSNGAVTGVTFNNGKNIGITQSGDNLTIAHDTFTTTEGTKTTAAPAHGTSFDVLDSITTSNGHITGFVKKTVTLPADNNTDTNVTQTAKSDNVNYPLLGAYAASPTSGTAAGTVYDTGMHMNPSTNTITATTFAGNATSATKLATARTIALTGSVTGSGSFDGSGNLSIATTTNHNHDSTYVNIDGDTMTGRLTTTGLTISSTSADNHIVFSRASANYFTSPASGYFCFVPNGKTISLANSDFSIEDTQVYPGTNNYTSLGTSSKRWKDIYCNSSITISGTTNEVMDATTTNPRIIFSESGSQPVSLVYTDYNNYRSPAGLKVLGTGTDASPAWFEVEGNIYGAKVYGAVWNDYAEYRNQKEEIKPGYCVASSDNGQVYRTTEKFQACDGIVSDTFGFGIGETDECKTPLAVAGRVLAYCEGDRYSYHAGDTVCAGPDGKVIKMTREEIREWPDRIIGIVSEIPEYETWGSGNVAVNGRIWIKVK